MNPMCYGTPCMLRVTRKLVVINGVLLDPTPTPISQSALTPPPISQSTLTPPPISQGSDMPPPISNGTPMPQPISNGMLFIYCPSDNRACKTRFRPALCCKSYLK
jgi:hypothetical protein